jgi:hypothetical protein
MHLSRSASRFGVSLRLLFSLALVMALSLGVAHAQILSGTIAGSVTDASDSVVPGAAVSVVHLGTGAQFHASTDAQGDFTITTLDPGMYKVTVEHAGFSKTIIEQVEVNVSTTVRVNIKLQIAKTGTEVVVEANATAVQTESVELKNSVDRQELDNMPLPTRNPLDLVKSFAGVMTPNGGTGITGGDAFVHGLRGNTTNLTQDGINVQDNTVKTSAFFALSSPVVDTIGEFNVTVGGVGTDAGFGSAQVSMVTMRGSNDIHGSVYWFQRNGDLNANTWFNNATNTPRPFQLQNHIGTTLGGPWYIPKVYNGKNKTFFFFAYEAYREPRSSPVERTVMTPSAETGLFTYTPTTGGGPQTVNLLNLGTIGNTGQKPVINATTFGIYQKIVPQTNLTNVGCAAGDTVNVTCTAFNEGGVNNQDRWTVRIDHQITSKNSFEFVWDRANFITTPDFLNGNQPPFLASPWSGGQSSPRESFVWALQSVISSTQTNEVRIGYAHSPVAFLYGNNFSETNGVQVGYAGVTSPIQTTTNFPQGRNTPVRQYIDNYAWVKGNHQLRFGGEYRQIVANSFNGGLVNPDLTLGSNASNPNGLSSAVLPGISAAELTIANNEFNNLTGLLGSISQAFNHTSPTSGYVAGVQQLYTPEQNNMALYIQDNWKVKRNLTVQYGVRWEYDGPYNARNGLVLLPQNNLSTLLGPTPITGSPVANLFQPGNLGGDMNPLLTLQGAQNGSNVTNPRYDNFAPFAGIAYALGKDSKTVIRSSFSEHYVTEGLTFWDLASTENTGLFTTASNSTPTGVFNPSTIASNLPTPIGGSFPVSQIANWLNFGGASPELAYDKNMKQPYVLEWSFGIQQDLGKHWLGEVRYVGNHAVDQYRTWNLNQLDTANNGVTSTFDAAQSNLAINVANGKAGFANNGLPGQVATPLLDELFAGLPSSAGYTSSTFITDLNQNKLFTMFNTIRTSPTYRVNVMGSNGLGAANGLPLNFFVADPWATSAFYVNNASWSAFNGLEIEIRRRFAGLTVQGNYTFSKVLADTPFAESQSENQNYQNIQNTGLDKFVNGINVTHSVGANFQYALPIGKGQRWLAGSNRAVNSVIGGWSLNGFTHWSTGAPTNLSSARATFGSGISSTPVLNNMTQSQLEKNVGIFETTSGVYYINPKSGLLNINGANSTANFCTTNAAGAVTETTPCFTEPAPGSLGNLSFNGINLPHFFDQDLSIVKDTQIYERMKLQLRLEAFDVFNNVNFAAPSTSTDATTFGQLTTTFDTARGGGVTARIVQFGVRVTF